MKEINKLEVKEQFLKDWEIFGGVKLQNNLKLGFFFGK